MRVAMKNNVLSTNLILRDCTGCSACEIICPQKAIKIELTADGFYEPSINEAACNSCGLCTKICYKIDANIMMSSSSNVTTYSAINKNIKELQTSTSGAVSIELMKVCLEKGYKVIGVAYDYDKNIAITKIACFVEELEKFKGSKYFQSYTVNALFESLKDSSEQKYAFFGTPCQVYAVSKYLKLVNRKDKFILIDIFCHGCPSINLWSKYLEYNFNRYSVTNFDKIDFRSKTYGWHEFSTTFHSNEVKFESSKINDPFYTIFFDKNALNKACYECKLRSTLAYTDIRLGDFWGAAYDLNTSGVSAVVLSTDRGKAFFNPAMKYFYIKEHELSEVIRFQSYGKKHVHNEKYWTYTLKLLASDLPMNEILKAYKKVYSINKKASICLKNAVKRLPPKIVVRLKKYAHNKLRQGI